MIKKHFATLPWIFVNHWFHIKVCRKKTQIFENIRNGRIAPTVYILSTGTGIKFNLVWFPKISNALLTSSCSRRIFVRLSISFIRTILAIFIWFSTFLYRCFTSSNLWVRGTYPWCVIYSLLSSYLLQELICLLTELKWKLYHHFPSVLPHFSEPWPPLSGCDMLMLMDSLKHHAKNSL